MNIDFLNNSKIEMSQDIKDLVNDKPIVYSSENSFRGIASHDICELRASSNRNENLINNLQINKPRENYEYFHISNRTRNHRRIKTGNFNYRVINPQNDSPGKDDYIEDNQVNKLKSSKSTNLLFAKELMSLLNKIEIEDGLVPSKSESKLNILERPLYIDDRTFIENSSNEMPSF